MCISSKCICPFIHRLTRSRCRRRRSDHWQSVHRHIQAERLRLQEMLKTKLEYILLISLDRFIHVHTLESSAPKAFDIVQTRRYSTQTQKWIARPRRRTTLTHSSVQFDDKSKQTRCRASIVVLVEWHTTTAVDGKFRRLDI